MCQHLGPSQDDVLRHNAWDPGKGETMPDDSCPFLDNPNFPFDFGHMFVGTCSIDSGSTRHAFNHNLESGKLSVRVDCSDSKASLFVELVDLHESIKYSFGFPVVQTDN